MNLSKKGAAFIRGHEGFVPRYYLDPVGVGTIGIGFTWRSSAFQEWWAAHKVVKFGPGAIMTRAEAEDALRYLCEREYGLAVNRHYGKPVAQHVFDASTSVTYNCGAETLQDRWAQAAKRGHYATAADYLETTRITANGRRLAGLVRRRKEEAALLEHGRYGAVAPQPKDAMEDGILVRGERGPAVAALIRDLHKLGFYNGKLDDVFGYGTEAAVLAFQRAAGLKADGYAGPKTLAAIAAAMAKKPNTKRNWLAALVNALLALFRRT